VLSGMPPCEYPNEASNPRVRESVERVLGGLDPVFGLVLVLLRELLLGARQRIFRVFQCLLAPPDSRSFPLTRSLQQTYAGM